MGARARVVVELELRDRWPGDDQFDEWVRNVVRHALERLGAVESAEVVEWAHGSTPSPGANPSSAPDDG
jgi:hypothetical protein